MASKTKSSKRPKRDPSNLEAAANEKFSVVANSIRTHPHVLAL